MLRISSVLLLISTIAIFFLGLCAPAAQSATDVPEIIRLPTSVNDDKGVCAGVRKPASCPINCLRTDPVCGEDGVTYWCGCADALCAGTRVAKLGFCNAHNDGSASLPGQALLLVHIIWLILLGFSVLCGLF